MRKTWKLKFDSQDSYAAYRIYEGDKLRFNVQNSERWRGEKELEEARVLGQRVVDAMNKN